MKRGLLLGLLAVAVCSMAVYAEDAGLVGNVNAATEGAPAAVSTSTAIMHKAGVKAQNAEKKAVKAKKKTAKKIKKAEKKAAKKSAKVKKGVAASTAAVVNAVQ